MKKTILLLALVALLPIYIMQAQQKQKTKKIQIALLLDTSNSMDGLIDQAKSQLWKIVNELASAQYNGETPVLEIALYEYGNDNLSGSEGHIRQLSQLTTDLDKISEELFALKTNGGSEYCGWVIDVATKQLSWTTETDDLKMIFIAGNEPFDQGSVNYKKSCANAIAKGIIVNTIFCGSEGEGKSTFWKDGADLADGKFMVINQNEVAVSIESPYDDDILKLNGALNQTYIYYGSVGQSMKTRQEVQDLNAMEMSKESAVQRSASKASGAYQNATWDLVDAVQNNNKKVEEIEAEELPAELKGKNAAEIKAYVEKKAGEREKLKKEISELNKKREDYVTEERKKLTQKNTLDDAMLGAIHELGKKKGLEFKK